MEEVKKKENSFLLGLSITLGTILVGLISYIFFTSNLPSKNEERCEYAGWAYAHGETFDSTDNCNVCVCNNGITVCTEMVCTEIPEGDLN
jgi:hypothetical protein